MTCYKRGVGAGRRRESIDLSLGIALEVWRSLPDVEREIDSWEQDDAVEFLVTWGIQEDRLRYLDDLTGEMTDEQLACYEELKAVVAENRPIIERLLLT